MNAWPNHAHTAADREHAGREGVALTEMERFRSLGAYIHRFRCTNPECRHYEDEGYFTPRDNDAASACFDWLRAEHVAARLAAQPVPAPIEGSWVCGVCGEGGPAHGEHGSRRDCAYEPVFKPVPAPSRTEASSFDRFMRDGLTRGTHSHHDGEHWVSLGYVLDLLDRAPDRILRDAQPVPAPSVIPVKRDEFSAERRDDIVEALSRMEGESGRWGYDRAADVLHAHEVEWCGRTDGREAADRILRDAQPTEDGA